MRPSRPRNENRKKWRPCDRESSNACVRWPENLLHNVSWSRVNEIILEIVELLRAEANQYAVSIRTDLVADLPKSTADRVQLQQVFMNLILNAIEAMQETGAGVLTGSRPNWARDGQLRISVSDTGVGLPKEKAEQIFDAFFTTKPHGSGMGFIHQPFPLLNAAWRAPVAGYSEQRTGCNLPLHSADRNFEILQVPATGT